MVSTMSLPGFVSQYRCYCLLISSAFNLDYLIDILISMHNVSFLFEKRPGRLLGYDMAKIVQDPHML